MNTQPKIIAVGDYIEDVDHITTIPVMFKSELSLVEVRIKKPMAEHSHKMMQTIMDTFGEDFERFSSSVRGKGEEVTVFDIPEEDRGQFIKFQWMHTCVMISSCCYHPDRDKDGNPVEVPRLVWDKAEDVATKCPDDLFKQLRQHISGEGISLTVSEVEAKK
jgi:hypothetical protein